MSDKSLSTGPELAVCLFDAGLAPPGVTNDGIAHLGTVPWEPWRRIADCWHLVQQFAMSITYAPVLEPYWWIEVRGVDPVRVHTFAEIPQGICQLALLAAERKG